MSSEESKRLQLRKLELERGERVRVPPHFNFENESEL